MQINSKRKSKEKPLGRNGNHNSTIMDPKRNKLEKRRKQEEREKEGRKNEREKVSEKKRWRTRE